MSTVDASDWTRQASSPTIDGNNPKNIRSGSYSITPTRTSVVAPSIVSFETTLHESSVSEDRFHSQEYSWDFDDNVGAPTWSTSGLSKNTAKGAVAAHVFESAGVFTVTLTVRDSTGIVSTATIDITVVSADSNYPTTNTICVNKVGDADFTGAPTGAQTINSDSVTTIATTYSGQDKRILFKRGSSWDISSDPDWAAATGQTIGAYGSGDKPLFNLQTGCSRFISIVDTQELTVMDLEFSNPTRDSSIATGGQNPQRILVLRCDMVGGSNAINWGHWYAGDVLVVLENAIVDCDLSDCSSNVIYAGSEYFALMGNTLADSRTTHVVRIWQGYKSVIQHNIITGSSLDNTNGRHALKLHGIEESRISTTPSSSNPDHLRYRTKFCMVSDNIFGTSGGFPVSLGPQNTLKDENLSDVIFERNKILTDYGNSSVTTIQASLDCHGRYHSVRNNICNGDSNLNENYRAIRVERRGIELSPTGVKVYNNTVYISDNASATTRHGVRFESECTNCEAYNNAVSFPGFAGTAVVIQDNTSGEVATGTNIAAIQSDFVDPENISPLLRDFNLDVGATLLIDVGTTIDLFEDNEGATRTQANFTVGALDA